jgi:adenine-specific DNA-methyltransferase
MNSPLKRPELVPAPATGESPTRYAARLGDWYQGRVDGAHRREFGHFPTPIGVARMMGELAAVQGQHLRLLDPGAGTGILGAPASEALAGAARPPEMIELVVYEVDAALRPALRASLSHLWSWLRARGIELRVDARWTDYVAANASALHENLLLPAERPFDAVIANPPYFKLSKSDARARACSSIVHGQPNIYALMMAIGVASLRENGRFVFITPRSYASGPYFRLFREWLFDRVVPTDLHVFESRTGTFGTVLQEALITAGNRAIRPSGKRAVNVSTSESAVDLDVRRTRTLRVDDVLRPGCANRVLRLPANPDHDWAERIVCRWTSTLHAQGFEVSTGPVVAFRARGFLRDRPGRSTIPLLWLQHVAPMRLTWPLNGHKPEHFLDCAASAPTIIPNRNYVVLRRFSAKEERRRLVAAPHIRRGATDYVRIAFENHLNYIHRPGGEMTADDAFGVAALLNSALLDTWFRIGSGNTQVSATELRSTPLPEPGLIRRIGRQVRRRPDDFEAIVASQLGYGG